MGDGFMEYKKFIIQNYRAIKGPLTIDISKKRLPLIALIGVNECGKTTILQAIFSFDSANDDFLPKNHFSSFINRYETSKEDCVITAEIEISSDTFCKIISSVKSDLVQNLYESGVCNVNGEFLEETEEQQKYVVILENLDLLKKKVSAKSNFIVRIDRKISSKETTDDALPQSKYYSTYFKSLDKDINHLICQEIVGRAPYILYNDDFNDRPNSLIIIHEELSEQTEWEKIYRRVFVEANQDLDDAVNADGYRQESILSDVGAYLSTSLNNAFKRFQGRNGKIEISLKLEKRNISNKAPNTATLSNTTTITNSTQNILRVSVVEEIQGKRRFFDLLERSKGFIWYYNFIMKIQFNPKTASDRGKNIFLLDEPGSYLHEDAQRELSKRLEKIAQNEGTVIFCTHSPQLLDPNFIPLTSVEIVEKSKTNSGFLSIKSTPFHSTKTKMQRTHALQPIYEALQLSEFPRISTDKKMVCVEGIDDYYALRFFCNLPDTISIFPCVSAQSITGVISYMLGFEIPFMVIWDNDVAGINARNEAVKRLGESESGKLRLLPINGRMEEMLTDEDHKNIMDALECSPKKSKKGSYQFYVKLLCKQTERQSMEIKKNLSEYAKTNFLNLEKMIIKNFSDA